MTAEERNWLRLHTTRGLGRVGLRRLAETFGPPEAILAASPKAWREKAGVRETLALAVPRPDAPELEKACRALDALGVRLIPLTDERYPPLLRAIPDPPALLYLRGELPDPESLAVVGARRASEPGRRLTETLCAELAARGVCIVSGLARGIDTSAHRGALAGGGTTAAVLGCGIDRIYPPENDRLLGRILEGGGAVLSEYPPGTEPLAGHFPGRNRIISGLCRGTLVVEAAEESGSLITADFALEQGREVFAVPGAVHNPTSGGVNRLLKEGAHLVTGADDILSVLWPRLPSPAARRREDELAATLPEPEKKVYFSLGEEPLHIDEVARKCALTPMNLSAILLHLELRGAVSVLPGMRYVRSSSRF